MMGSLRALDENQYSPSSLTTLLLGSVLLTALEESSVLSPLSQIPLPEAVPPPIPSLSGKTGRKKNLYGVLASSC